MHLFIIVEFAQTILDEKFFVFYFQLLYFRICPHCIFRANDNLFGHPFLLDTIQQRYQLVVFCVCFLMFCEKSVAVSMFTFVFSFVIYLHYKDTKSF